jgi:hypothetical protein
MLIFVSVVSLTACKGVSEVPPNSKEVHTTERIVETIRDTVFRIEADTSYYKAWLEAPQPPKIRGKLPKGELNTLGKNALPKITLREISKKGGKHLKPPTVRIKDNVLTVNCEAEAQELFAQWKEKHTEQLTRKTETIYVPVDKPPSHWQMFQIWCGRILMGLLLLALIAWQFPIYKLIPKK